MLFLLKILINSELNQNSQWKKRFLLIPFYTHHDNVLNYAAAKCHACVYKLGDNKSCRDFVGIQKWMRKKPIFYPFKHSVTMICNKNLVISCIFMYTHKEWMMFSPQSLCAQPNNCYLNVPCKWKNEHLSVRKHVSDQTRFHYWNEHTKTYLLQSFFKRIS